MRNNDVYNWQQDDLTELSKAFEQRILLIHNDDFDSSQNVIWRFKEKIEERRDYKIFCIESYTTISSPLTPFINCLISKENKSVLDAKKILGVILKDCFKMDIIPYILENFNKSLVDNLLPEKYKDILISIKKITNDLEPIFIFKDYPKYDSATQELILYLLEDKLSNCYTFLKGAKFIFLCDTNEDENCYIDISKYAHSDVNIHNPSKEDIYEIAQRYNLSFTDEYEKKIFELSSGRLGYMELIFEYLESYKTNFSENDIVNIASDVLNKRMENLKKWKESILNVLGIAAEIGEEFKLDWLNHTLSESEQKELDNILSKSNNENLVICTEENGKFRNKIIWEYFYKNSLDKKEEIGKLLLKTVAHFCPNNYYTLGYYAEQAGDLELACEYYLFEVWERCKDGLDLDDKFLKNIEGIIEKFNCKKYINILIDYYKLLSENQYKIILDILESDQFYTNIPLRICLMKDYLVSLTYYKSGNSKEKTSYAIQLMETIKNQSENIKEMPLWCNSMSTLISFYANTGNVDKADLIFKKLTYYYKNRISFDPYAEKSLNILNRKSNAIYPVEYSISLTEQSVTFFSTTMYYSQYLMALNNHAANCFVLRKLEHGISCLEEAIKFINNNPTVNINPVYIWNNYFLIKFYSNLSQREIIISKMEKMIKQIDDIELKIIPLINISVFYALHDNDISFDKTIKLLKQAEILNENLQDDYYEYFINVNFLSTYYLKNDIKSARIYLEKIEKIPKLLKKSEYMLLKKRNEEWNYILDSSNIIQRSEFDTYLLHKYPDDIAWKHFGRGFLTSDLQFWSEA